MNYHKKYIPLLLGIAVAAGILIGSKLNFANNGDVIFAKNSKKEKLNRLIDYIDYEYVDEVNTDSIVDVTVNGILENLDPHSVYIPVSDYERTADDMRGNFTGIGISFYVYKDSIAVIRTIEGGPAEAAGIKAGDRIIAAGGEPLYGENIDRDSISEKLKGKRNSKITLTVKRDTEILDIVVTREQVPLVSVESSYMLDEALGYIKLNRFSETTYTEFKKALTRLKKEGAKKLILDLRNNPGGYINIAEQIVDEFLEDDTLMLITKNKNGEEDASYATSKGDFEDGKLYVLIDENSASASEIVAGALQDNDKGVIVGRRSFGKGLVQREMALGDGSAVRLTIARYYTPTGRSIQKPYGANNDDYFNEYEKRYKNGELQHKDSITVADSLKYTTPKGKIVYGGGGIIPDVFVPKDTRMESQTIEYVSRNGFMSYFVFEYLNTHRHEFDDITQAQFVYGYQVSNELVQQFLDYAKLDNSTISYQEYQNALKKAIKANLAEQLYGTNAAAIILNMEDPAIEKVLELERKTPLQNIYD